MCLRFADRQYYMYIYIYIQWIFKHHQLHPSTTSQSQLILPKNNMNPHPFFAEGFTTSQLGAQQSLHRVCGVLAVRGGCALMVKSSPKHMDFIIYPLVN